MAENLIQEIVETGAPAPVDAVKDSTPDTAVAPVKDAEPKAASEPAKAPEPTWREDWRQTLAKGDEKRLKTLERYASVEALADKLFEQEKVIRAGQVKQPFPDKGTPEQQAEWRKTNGVPEASDKYELSLPEGLVLSDNDKPLLEHFLKEAHASNLDSASANTAVRAYLSMRQAEGEAQAERDVEFMEENRAILQKEYGGEYSRNLNALKNYLSTLPDGFSDLIMNGRTADGTPYGSDARVLRVWMDIAKQLNPAATVIPGGNESSVASEIESINTLRRTDPDKYWADKAMQARYGELLTAQEQLGKLAR